MSYSPRSTRRSLLSGTLGGLVTAVAVLSLAACSGEQPDGEPSPSPPAIEGVPPEPDQATAQAYIEALQAIDPDIVHGEPEKAIDRGRNQCSSIHEAPNDQARLVELTRQRFTSPDQPEGFSVKAGQQILTAVRTYICP